MKYSFLKWLELRGELDAYDAMVESSRQFQNQELRLRALDDIEELEKEYKKYLDD